MSIRSGDTIENPTSGERITFNQPFGASASSLGFTLHLAPGASGPREHVHPKLSESFCVTSGTLTALIDGQRRVFQPEEKLTVAPGTRHCFWNESESDVILEIEASPQLAMVDLLETMFALGRLGFVDSTGKQSVLRLSRVLPQFWSDTFYATQPPLLLQKMGFAVMGPLARALGYPKKYDYPTEGSGR